MKFKIDENLPVEIADLLKRAGYDALTVSDEKLSGIADPEIISVCNSEDRTLISLDLGFANIHAYPPENLPGVIVLRFRK
jgi:predicted nuclease of predicted toxin-antitoxin system